MSKMSENFGHYDNPRLKTRLVMMVVALIVIAGALIFTEYLRRKDSDNATDTEQEATTEPAPTGRIATTLSTTDDGVSLEVRKTGSSAPTPYPEPPEVPLPAATDDGKKPDETDSDAPAMFDVIVDGHPMQEREAAAYNEVSAHGWSLRNAPEDIEILHVSRYELMKSPKKYRNKVIRVKGTLLRVRPDLYNADDNHPDRPRTYYECILKSADEDIFVVHVFEDPISQGRLRADIDIVTVNACFLKNWGYLVQDVRHVAPFLIGYRLEKVEFPDTLAKVSAIVIGAIGCLIVIVLVAVRMGRQRTRQMLLRMKRESMEAAEIPEPHLLPRDKEYTDCKQSFPGDDRR